MRLLIAGSNLKVSALGFEPVLDVALGISGKTEHEVPLDLQLVDGLNGLVDLKEGKQTELVGDIKMCF